MKKNNIQEELKNIAPLLVQQKGKKNAFTVPEDYFLNLEKQILEQVQEEEKVVLTKPTAKIFRLPVAVLGKAAAVLLLIGGSLFFFQQNLDKTTNTMALSSEEIAIYLADNIQDFEEELLIDQSITADFFSSSLAPLNPDELDVYMEEMVEDLEYTDLEDLL